MNKQQAQKMLSDIKTVIEFIKVDYDSITRESQEPVSNWHIMTSRTLIPPMLSLLTSAEEDLESHILNWSEEDSENIDSTEEPCHHEKLVGNVAKVMLDNIRRQGVVLS